MKKLFSALAILTCLGAGFAVKAANNYQTTVASQNPAYHFKLDNSLVDAVGGSVTLTAMAVSSGFTNDIFGSANNAYYINGNADTLLGPSNIVSGVGPGADAAATGTGSISMLFRMLSDTNNTGQRYIFSQGTNTLTSNQLGLFLENTSPGNGDINSLKLRIGTTTVTIITNQFLVANVWYYFAMTYDEARNADEVHWYVGQTGSTLTTGTNNISNSAIVGDSTTGLYIGNRISLNNAFRNPGVGIIDEFATWSRELTISEINAQFSATSGGSPVLPTPKLTATQNGGNMILSWTTNSDPAFQLESSTFLPNAGAWAAGGSPTVVGTNNTVTNAISAANQNFYRLKKP